MVIAAIDKLILELEMKLKNVDKIDRVNKKVDSLGKTSAKAGKSFSGLSNGLLQFGLSALFAGMAIKQFSQSVIRSLANTFTLLADEMSVGRRRVLELQAAFQFLKFVLFDVFASTEFFGTLVEFIVNLINKISEFVQKNPLIATMIGLFLLLGVVVGAVALVFGQVVLGLLGIAALVGVISGPIALAFAGILIWVVLIAIFLLLALNHLRQHPEQVILLKKAWDRAFASLKGIFNVFREIVAVIGIDLPSASKTAFALLVALANTWASALEGILIMLQSFVNTLKAIKSGDLGAAVKSIGRGFVGFEKTFGASFRIPLEFKRALAEIEKLELFSGDLSTASPTIDRFFGETPAAGNVLPDVVNGAGIGEAKASVLEALGVNTAETNQTLQSIQSDGIKINDTSIELLSRTMGATISQGVVQSLLNNTNITSTTDL